MEKKKDPLLTSFKTSLGRQILEAIKEDEQREKLKKAAEWKQRKEKLSSLIQTHIVVSRKQLEFVIVNVILFYVIFILIVSQTQGKHHEKMDNDTCKCLYSVDGPAGPPGEVGKSLPPPKKKCN